MTPATALSAGPDTITSANSASLIAEVEAADAAADEAVTKARERALDPLVIDCAERRQGAAEWPA